MTGSLNRVTLIGNLGRNPEIKSMQNGGKVATFSLACSESWKDKTSSERKERTQWINVAVWNEGLVGVVERYVKKGSKIFVEGQLETRKYQKDGHDVYVTEVVLRPFKGDIILLDGKGAASGSFSAAALSGG